MISPRRIAWPQYTYSPAGMLGVPVAAPVVTFDALSLTIHWRPVIDPAEKMPRELVFRSEEKKSVAATRPIGREDHPSSGPRPCSQHTDRSGTGAVLSGCAVDQRVPAYPLALKTSRLPGMWPFMAAIVGYVLGESFTEPQIAEIAVRERENLVYVRCVRAVGYRPSPPADRPAGGSSALPVRKV